MPFLLCVKITWFQWSSSWVLERGNFSTLHFIESPKPDCLHKWAPPLVLDLNLYLIKMFNLCCLEFVGKSGLDQFFNILKHSWFRVQEVSGKVVGTGRLHFCWLHPMLSRTPPQWQTRPPFGSSSFFSEIYILSNIYTVHIGYSYWPPSQGLRSL